MNAILVIQHGQFNCNHNTKIQDYVKEIVPISNQKTVKRFIDGFPTKTYKGCQMKLFLSIGVVQFLASVIENNIHRKRS